MLELDMRLLSSSQSSDMDKEKGQKYKEVQQGIIR